MKDILQVVKNQSAFVSHLGKIRSVYNEKNTLEQEIRFRITDRCNLDCSYCVEHGKRGHATCNDFGILFDNMTLMERPSFSFYIFGGEPLLNPNLIGFFSILEKHQIYEKVKNIEIISNLKLNESILLEIHSIIKTKLKLSTSIHFEYNTKDTIEKLTKLSRSINIGSVEVMVDERTNILFDDLVRIWKKTLPDVVFSRSFISKMKKLNCSFCDGLKYATDFEPILNKFLTVEYANGLTKASYLDTALNFCSKGFECFVPKNCFVLNYDGIVFPCQEFFLNSVSSKFNLFVKHTKEEIQANLDISTICPFERCSCEQDVLKKRI